MYEKYKKRRVQDITTGFDFLWKKCVIVRPVFET